MAAIAASVVLFGSALGANGIGGNFEIDTDANLLVDGAAPAIDWLAGGTGTAMRTGVLAQQDKPTGQTDDAFGQGTAEDQAVPTVKNGSIPPKKSDLKTFGVFKEQGANASYLDLFWTRVQDPSGTTNMDFEFNKLYCDPVASPPDPDCSSNGITPNRSIGDLLIEYHLENGGVAATLSLREWTGSAWGGESPLTGKAIGSINSTLIAAADSGGLGSLDPRTFGEASINLTEVLGTAQCVTFGSAYLKSRSSDSFSSEIKDFIAPEPVSVTNCGSVEIVKKDDAGNPLPNATFVLYTDNAPVGGAAPAGPEDVATSLTCTTSTADGKCTILNVPFGNYWAVETVVPPGYTAAADKSLTVSAANSSVSVEFVDVRQKGSIRIVKTDDGGTLMNGITFTASQGGTAVGSCTTGLSPNATGECTIANLPIGTYSLSEDASDLLPGFTVDPSLPKDVVVTSNTVTTVNVVNPRRHKIIVIACHEGNVDLFSVDVKLGTDTKQTLATAPAGFTAAQLCGLGGASFGGLGHGKQAPEVNLAAHP